MAIRTLLFPAFLAAELLGVAFRLAKEEEVGYSATGKVNIFVDRFRACWEDSAALFVQAFVYVLFLDMMAALGIQHVIRNFRPELESAFAAISGKWYTAADGRKYPSNPSAADVSHALLGGHSLDGHTKSCPDRHSGDGAPTDCACRAAFFAACSKLCYEELPIVRDVVTNRWGLALLAYNNVPADLHLKDTYIPDMVWFAAASSQGLVLCFEGAQLFYKIDRGTDIPVAMSNYPGCGRMQDGLVRGLEQPGHTGRSIYEEIEAVLQRHAGGRRIFITGHSLGGALAVILAQLLAVRNPDLAARIGGIFTYGGPRIGDEKCVELVNQRYGGRAFRYVHAADIVCKLPHRFKGIPYAHHAGERFITSFALPGRSHRLLKEEEDPKAVASTEQWEGSSAYGLSIAKLGWLLWHGQFSDALLAATMLGMPGMADHFLGHYQEALEEVLQQEGTQPSCAKS